MASFGSGNRSITAKIHIFSGSRLYVYRSLQEALSILYQILQRIESAYAVCMHSACSIQSLFSSLSELLTLKRGAQAPCRRVVAFFVFWSWLDFGVRYQKILENLQ